MLETLTRGFSAAREKLGGTRELTEANVDESLRDVRMSLLEADVDFGVVKDFLTRVKQRALGEKVETRVRDAAGRTLRVTPGQHFVKICEEELVRLMGPAPEALATDRHGTTSVMLTVAVPMAASFWPGLQATYSTQLGGSSESVATAVGVPSPTR